jgi:hypothetical protein
MPLPNWLRLPPRTSTSSFPAQNLPADPALPFATAQSPVDNAVRTHIAASDPAFPAKREAAMIAILAAIEPVAAAHGFTKKAKSWAKTGPLGLVSLHVQRSRFGFEAVLNLCFQPTSGEPPGPWARDDFVPLGQFYAGVSAGGDRPDGADGLVYLDIHDNAAALDAAMQVLANAALPWLLAHLTDPEAPLISFPRIGQS